MPEGRSRRDAAWGEIRPPVAGIDPTFGEAAPLDPDVGPDGRDLALVRELQEAEAVRRRQEEEEGAPVTVLEYTPGGAPRIAWGRIAMLLLVLVVILASMYWIVIPRADAELVIQYNEGLMGGINVDARIENHGTRDMENVRLTILVQNSSDVRMADPMVFEGVVLSHGDSSMDAISFTADQWETYHIFAEWHFEVAGRSYSGSNHYHTDGDEMNIWFHEDLTP